VAVQIRETRNALTAQAYQARSDAQQDVLVRVAESEGLSSILAKVQPIRLEHDLATFRDFDLAAVDALSETELRQFANLHQALALRHDNTAHQYYAGYISDADIHHLMGGLDLLLPLWKHLNVRINPSLQRYLDDRD
jgi:hypothetical protein